MARTLALLVYSPNQFRVREVVLTDNDDQIPLHITRLRKGECHFVVRLNSLRELGPTRLLQVLTGHAATSDRCNVLSGNTAVATCLADPRIDFHPRGRLVLQ